jgi:hypothetical protein
MAFVFTPTEEQQSGISVPYLEEARADYAPYYDVRGREPKQVQREVIAEFDKLDAGNVQFREGFFGDKKRRYGYEVTFIYGGARGRMQIAGLPMRTETEAKKRRVLLQALSILRDWLKTQVTAQVFAPGNDPLMQFLLVDGQRTVNEYLIETRKLPTANPLLTDVVEGVIES